MTIKTTYVFQEFSLTVLTSTSRRKVNKNYRSVSTDVKNVNNDLNNYLPN